MSDKPTVYGGVPHDFYPDADTLVVALCVLSGSRIRGSLSDVDIRSSRRFDFDHDRPTVWAALERVDQYPVWWPWIRCDGRSLADGAPWGCTVKPPLPYSLHFELDIVEVVQERLIRAELTGDLIGDARVTLDESDHDCRCTVRLESSLAAVAGPARLLSRFAPPLAIFGHDWVLDAGAQRFRSLALGGQQR